MNENAKNKETPSLVPKKPSKEEVVSNLSVEKENQEFTAEKLQQVWTEFGKHRKETGVGEMEQLVLGRSIEKIGDTEVLITLNSDLEVTILEKFEMQMLAALRKNLVNDNITLKKTVKEDKSKPKLYTNSDKYDYLVKQNPKLKNLKDELGLDFEF